MKYVSCDCCDSDDWQLVYSRSQVPHAAGPIVQCNVCGLVYVNPRDFEKQWFDVPEVLQSYLEAAKSRLPVYRYRLEQIERYKRGGKLLEVGCYAGAFLNLAKQHGWECSGVEPSPVVSEYARKSYGVNIFPGFLREARLSSNSFDVIVLFHVLEHLSSPKRELFEIHRILREKGTLVIEVPDIEHPVHKLAKKPKWLFVPGHFYYFSQQTLRNLLERVGFEIIEVQPSYKIVSVSRILSFVGPKLGQQLTKLVNSLVKKLHIEDSPIKIRTSLNFLIFAKPKR